MLRSAEGNGEIVSSLLMLGANVNAQDDRGLSTLDWAIRGNEKLTSEEELTKRIGILERLFVEGPEPALLNNAYLSIARLDILFTDRSRPERPYARVNFSLTPLMRFIEANGGDPSAAFEKGSSGKERDPLLIMLDNPGFRLEPFYEIAWLARNHGFMLFSNGDKNGFSCLHYLFAHPRRIQLPSPETTTLLRLLLSFGADPEFKANGGETPLHNLVKQSCSLPNSLKPYPGHCDKSESLQCQECLRSAEILIDHGADPEERDFKGNSVLAELEKRPQCALKNKIESSLKKDLKIPGHSFDEIFSLKNYYQANHSLSNERGNTIKKWSDIELLHPEARTLYHKANQS